MQSINKIKYCSELKEKNKTFLNYIIYFKIKLVNLPCSKNITSILNDYKIYKITENKSLDLDE